MYCRQCGTQLPDGGSFCPQCGLRVVPPKVQQKPAAQQPNPPVQQVVVETRPLPPTYRAGNIIMLVLNALFCCILTGIPGCVLNILGLVFGGKVRKLASEGDFDGARRAGKRARLFMLLSILIFILGLVLMTVALAEGMLPVIY